MFLAFAVAIFGFYTSYTAVEAFSYANWQHYSSLALVDLCFLYIISMMPVFNLRKRYMSCILAISIFITSISSVILYVYEMYNSSLFDYLAINTDLLYPSFSFIMSILLIIISITPKGMLSAFDRRFWPSSFDHIYSFGDNSCHENNERGIS